MLKSKLIINENKGDPNYGFLLSPTNNVPYRDDVKGMVVVCDNPSGKLVYKDPKDIWSFSLEDIGDVDVSDKQDGDYLQYIDGKWVCTEVGSSVPCGKKGEIQLADEYGRIGTCGGLYFDPPRLKVQGSITDGIFKKDGSNYTVNSILLTRKKNFVVETRLNKIIDIEGNTNGSVTVNYTGVSDNFILILKGLPKNYSKSSSIVLATLRSDTNSEPWVSVSTETENDTVLVYLKGKGPRESPSTFCIGYMFI